jgi:hypothetical protein
MSHLCTFRDAYSGQPVFVRPDLVRAVEPDPNEKGTIIVFSETHRIAVIEGPKEVVKALDDADRP